MKRVFYIANAYDGSYFVLTDNLEEYFQRLSAYAMNLHTSQKVNHYSFGSVEMTETEYLTQRDQSSQFEQERIKIKEEKVEEEISQEVMAKEDSLPDNVIPLF